MRASPTRLFVFYLFWSPRLWLSLLITDHVRSTREANVSQLSVILVSGGREEEGI